ncbi:MAG: SPOR domain-containing protein [Gammaproteobacteria bacterium]|nr:SPOR domain-containing protein [Gammaproteobacteria bacterium]
MSKQRNIHTNYRKKPVKRGSNTSQPSLRAWIIALGLILVFVLGLFYLDHYRNTGPRAAFHRLLANKEQARHSVTEPDFEFYTALPSGKLTEMPVAAPTKKISTPQTNATPVATVKPNTAPVIIQSNPVKSETKPVSSNVTAYFLQVGAFPHYPDADKLKAQLLLDNFNANVTDYKVNNTEWFRVLVGPFHDLTALNHAQTALAALHYQSIRFQLTPSTSVAESKK